MKRIGVIGATGAVGRQMLEDLEEWQEEKKETIEVYPFASYRSEGIRIPYGQTYLKVQEFSLEKLRKINVQAVLMSAGGDFSRTWAKAIGDLGPFVIDNSSAWRMNPDVPLVVPEINGSEISRQTPIIANPNCLTIQVVMALYPLHRAFGLKKVHIVSYQSVSGTGQKGISELSDQIQQQLKFQEPQVKVYPQIIAHNVIPIIGAIDEDGYCEEERKIILETRKILKLHESIDVMATTARVPVFSGHSAAVSVELKEPISKEQAIEALSHMPGLVIESENHPEKIPTAYFASKKKEVFVSRLRLKWKETVSRELHFWNVADNLRKGAATNAVQVLELLDSLS